MTKRGSGVAVVLLLAAAFIDGRFVDMTVDREPSADGTAAAGAYLQYPHGVAVGPDSRIYFAEERIRPTTHQLVRTVDGGKLKTVLGRDLAGLTAREWRSARTREGGSAGPTPAAA